MKWLKATERKQILVEDPSGNLIELFESYKSILPLMTKLLFGENPDSRDFFLLIKPGNMEV